MTKTDEKLKDAIDSTGDAAKEAVTDAAGLAHKIGQALKDGANEVANVAGQTLETVGRQMKDTTKDVPPPEK